MIKIEFTMGEAPWVFKDAIVIPDTLKLSGAEIEAEKQRRYDEWLAIVTKED